jgi:hypothetical protein
MGVTLQKCRFREADKGVMGKKEGFARTETVQSGLRRLIDHV